MVCVAAEVELTTLAAIWASHVPAGQDVHFLKVDVEGAEAAIVRSTNWSLPAAACAAS